MMGILFLVGMVAILLKNNITLSINTDVTLTANFVQNVSSSIDKFEMFYT